MAGRPISGFVEELPIAGDGMSTADAPLNHDVHIDYSAGTLAAESRVQPRHQLGVPASRHLCAFALLVILRVVAGSMAPRLSSSGPTAGRF
ncbi:MAG: hypothetical protein LBM94_05185 [Propionibacteriaceae bacterium]|nr:hypothetical protein [Propionibacteriaceae bacterium]